jgi:hypothetical protein
LQGVIVKITAAAHNDGGTWLKKSFWVSAFFTGLFICHCLLFVASGKSLQNFGYLAGTSAINAKVSSAGHQVAVLVFNSLFFIGSRHSPLLDDNPISFKASTVSHRFEAVRPEVASSLDVNEKTKLAGYLQPVVVELSAVNLEACDMGAGRRAAKTYAWLEQVG